MLEGGKITSKQAGWLTISVIISTAILFMPAIVVGQAKQDAWLSVILSTILGLIITYIVITLGLRFPDKTIIEYSQDVLGKFLGKIFGLVYILWLIYFESVVIREFSDFLITTVMRETPLLVFVFSIVFVSWFTVIQGLEVIARTNEFLLPFIIASILFIVIMVSPDINTKMFFPVLEKGFIPIIKGAYTPLAWFGEIATMLMIIPYINSPKEIKKSFPIAILVISFLLIIGGVTSIGVLGPAQSASLEFPFFLEQFHMRY
jgi:spore germination protein KB